MPRCPLPSKYILLISAALLLIVGLMSFIWITQEALERQAAQVDAYMSQVRAIHYDDDGFPIKKAHIARWQHFSNKSYTTMTSPRLSIHQADGKYWHISANNGISPQKHLRDPIASIELLDNVLITFKSQGAVEQDWQLSTEAITLNSTEAHTTLPVRLQGPQGRIEAVGLKAQLESGYVEFLSHVKTHYTVEHAAVPESPDLGDPIGDAAS